MPWRLLLAAAASLAAAPAQAAAPPPVPVAVARAEPPAAARLDTRRPAAASGDDDRGGARDAPAFPPWRLGPEDVRARSVGRPNRGHLERAAALPASGPGFVRVDRDSHYGTDETVALLTYVAARYAAAFPDTAPLLVGDLSGPEGGRLRPHRSHRTGRDADIGFPEREPRPRGAFARTLALDEIDLGKAWFVLETLVLTGRVQYVFVDASLLAPLAAAARDAGWSDEDVDRLFLFPEEDSKRGVVRAVAGHDTHFHVRFACPPGDDGCESY